jgi:curved DNA-binding protein CbpA
LVVANIILTPNKYLKIFNMNPYIELEISIDASEDEIKLKFRSLAQIHHPDKGGDEEVFKRIKLAYEILIDPIRRKEYDLLGEADSNQNIKQSALDHITQMLHAIVPNFNPENDDLITIMVGQINQIKVDMANNIIVCEQYILQLEKVIRRINSKNKNRNILLDVVQLQIKQRKQEFEDFNTRIKICNLELEILKDYFYGLEELVAIS